MSTDKEFFVFTVCGDAEHIDALNYSLKALRKYTTKPIVVVTDAARNTGTIAHDNIVQVNTPQQFNHHQASIYLKTGLHKFLPAGNMYCYLDSDVVAISPDVNSIFERFVSPITFAADHCTMDEFSPFCVNCGCLENFRDEIAEFRQLETEQQANAVPYKQALAVIDEQTAYNKRNPVVYFYHTLRYHLPGTYYRLNADFFLNKKNGQWVDADKVPLEDKYGIHRFYVKRMHLKWNAAKQTYLRKNGKGFFELTCNHLAENIYKTFGVECSPENWQHWNGGVFLFNDTSQEFLNGWHEDTLSIFNTPEWKTRDQGTLIANVFKRGLQQHPVLDRHYNYIVDYTSQKDRFNADMVSETQSGEKIKPLFLHVFHHFGDADWSFWRNLENYLQLRFERTG